MAEPRTHDTDTQRVFAAAGTTPTATGRARARAKLAAAVARTTPARRAEISRQLRPTGREE